MMALQISSCFISFHVRRESDSRFADMNPSVVIVGGLRFWLCSEHIFLLSFYNLLTDQLGCGRKLNVANMQCAMPVKIPFACG